MGHNNIFQNIMMSNLLVYMDNRYTVSGYLDFLHNYKFYRLADNFDD